MAGCPGADYRLGRQWICCHFGGPEQKWFFGESEDSAVPAVKGYMLPSGPKELAGRGRDQDALEPLA